MPGDTLPPRILARHPELATIGEALDALREGRPITTRCATCGQILEVTEVEGTGTLWIRCRTGCTSFRAHRDKR